MSDPSGAAYQALQNQTSLKYGDYNVTKDWIYIQNPLLGQGGAGVAVVNPNDPTQRFYLNNPNDSEAQQLQNFLNKPSGVSDWGSYNEQLNAQYLNNGTFDSSGRYDSAWANTSNQTLSALAEQKRLQDLTAQYQTGAMTREQIGTAANNASLQAATPYQNVYQQTYDNTVANQTTPASGVRAFSDERNAQQAAIRNRSGTQDYSNFQGLSYDDLVAAQTQNGGTAENPYRGAMPQVPQMPQVPTQNVSINPSITTGSSTMGGGSTNLDVQSALQKNMKFREQLIQSMMPTAQETALQQQMAGLNDQARGTQLSAQAGILNTSNKLVPMQAIIGEQRNIVEQANLKLQTIAAQQDAVTGQLQIAQTKRTALQNILKLQLEFGQQDLEMAQDAAALAKEYADEVKAEQKEAKALALQMGITKQFYDVGGTIYRTSDGKAYSTPEAFFADGGAQDWSNVDKIEPPQAERDTQVVTANGRTLLIDKNTGETIQDLGGAYKTGSGSGGGGSYSGSTGIKSSMDTAGEVKTWILANKRANADMPYYDLWGQLADQLRAEGLNPDNYNKVFWEVLHPEGTAGYTKYVTSSGREL